ncbi:hypothetical protein PTSG_09612 [Salpingoeca rosetta]|uniref:Phosphatidate phosphatase APP1 catalytic domain-containing protein n=1 Tax=Salpingoeca rosetta (strain ATCC 50818 / BSB-021) TaxID=946362 RepID=F2ULI0_SALR5|nr:uncharacterized protein PTSG_09612 [Salpingoeca rosetta]EGD77979.1 hypothetical protein PTSG_09612 [Salpingoeca rosetta]|eukprot:XP_004990041.1 hypothetical protein PTSG_09612 [Salpingoeca rosetta]
MEDGGFVMEDDESVGDLDEEEEEEQESSSPSEDEGEGDEELVVSGTDVLTLVEDEEGDDQEEGGEKDDDEQGSWHTLPEAEAIKITAINRLLKARRLRSKYERDILRIMSELQLDGNTIARHMDIKTAFARFRDHHGWRGLNYTHLLAQFTDFHGHDLTVATKARLVECACGSKKRRQRGARELFILRLFQSCSPEELSELKLQLQSSVINLSRILDQHMTDRQLRQRLYTIIAEKAHKYRQQHADHPPDVHVLSDIDDTFVHSGYGLGGPKYPKGTVLPGALSLLSAVSTRVAFVTARPAFVERRTFHSLQRMGVTASVLCGHLSDSLLIPLAPAFCNSRISSTKVRNVVRYSLLFPECRFVWFGDSGQGDVLTALELLQQAQQQLQQQQQEQCAHERVSVSSVLGEAERGGDGAGKEPACGRGDVGSGGERRRSRHGKANRLFGGQGLVAAYIQDVVLEDGVTFKTPHEERRRLAALGVHVVDNYIAVALHMHLSHSLLTPEQLSRVARGAIADLKAAAAGFTRPGVKVARFNEHRTQLERVNHVLRKAKLPELMFKDIAPTPPSHLAALNALLKELPLASLA